MSKGTWARATPVIPPSTKFTMKPQEKSMALLRLIRPPQSVASQLKNLIPVGTAMKAVAIVKKRRIHGGVPLVNMWWAQTTSPRTTIAMIEYTMVT